MPKKEFKLGSFAAGRFFATEPGAAFPSEVWGAEGRAIPSDALAGASSVFGFVYDGILRLTGRKSASDLKLTKEMFFAVQPSRWNLELDGKVLLIRNPYSKTTDQFGGPAEDIGRLRYLDGCTDSILVYPVKLGDPCMNLLVFSPGIRQARHVHPSFRAGIVIRGEGQCVLNDGLHELRPGQIFLIPEETEHSFNSGPNGLSVIAYHPDSDWGPTDEVHPMINRTFLR